MSYWGFRPHVPVAARRAQAAKEIEKLGKKGRAVSPVVVEGRKIARSFWGKAWCDNLERYSDFVNRLPRGRAYVNNGSVIDLQIARGKVEASERALQHDPEIAFQIFAQRAERGVRSGAECLQTMPYKQSLTNSMK